MQSRLSKIGEGSRGKPGGCCKKQNNLQNPPALETAPSDGEETENRAITVEILGIIDQAPGTSQIPAIETTCACTSERPKYL